MVEKGKYATTTKIIEGTSKIFQGGKTVIPTEVRMKMNLADGDRLVWIREETRWIVENAKQ